MNRYTVCNGGAMRGAVLAIVVLLGTAARGATEEGNAKRIRPYGKNPRYWQYQGKPVLLLGGSKDDNLFQISDLKEHLDLLAKVGCNVIRNTMSSRDAGNVQPFRKVDGKYDLAQWNEEYWRRFERMLQWTRKRDIIVQVEVWGYHDFFGKYWLANPWNPANTISYSAADSKLKSAYANTRTDRHAFFWSVPKLDNNTVLLKHQRRFVDKVLSHTLRYDHVLYCMTNEIFSQNSPEWGWYWAGYIKQAASRAGKTVETSEMYQETDLRHKQHRASLDHPKTYSFVDMSQNSTQTGQQHWDRLQFVYGYLAKRPRPINHTKTYGANTGPKWTGRDRDAEQRFWRNIIGGAASCRFHRPPAGMGLGEPARRHIRSMRMLTAELDVFKCTPDSHSRLLTDRTAGEAFLTCHPGREYAMYFPAGGVVGLDLRNMEGGFTVRWLDITHSKWRKPTAARGGAVIPLKAPGKGHWAVLVRRSVDAPSRQK